MPVTASFRLLLLSLASLALPFAAAAAEPPARLNPNTATQAELQHLPQLDAALAAHILASRPYASIGEFDEALSDYLDEEAREALFEVLFVPIALNSAPRDDIMLIPGMSARMAYEFEEYRPYDSLAQFDREIGKYVDDEEVARLRSYVTLDEN